MLNECLEGLNIKPNGIYIDATFGGGGHSQAILNQLDSGKLIAFDQDADAMENKINDERFIFVHHNFKYLKNFLKYHGIEQVDGILADLGVSSHHFDEKERGFSYRFDSKLDMRMNTQSELSAIEVLNNYDLNELTRIFKEFGELSNAYKIAGLIVNYRKNNKITTTGQLFEAIKEITPANNEYKLYSKVFQAIRMEVNKELEVLQLFLNQAINALKIGGRLAVITFHSLEDRLVKNFFKTGNFSGEVEKDFYGNILSPFKMITKKPLEASAQELKKNSRAASAKLRIVEKIL
jgi:16S rRNA (cytosine1402-N4)-methyltransferase